MEQNIYGYVIAPEDNVAVALGQMQQGDYAVLCGSDDRKLCCRDTISEGHKISVKQIVSGEAIVKGGFAIGVACRDILPGEHVHIHNLCSFTDTGGHRYDNP